MFVGYGASWMRGDVTTNKADMIPPFGELRSSGRDRQWRVNQRTGLTADVGGSHCEGAKRSWAGRDGPCLRQRRWGRPRWGKPISRGKGLLCLPYGKPGSDSGSLQQRKGLLHVAKKVGRREVSDPLQLGGWVWGDFKEEQRRCN